MQMAFRACGGFVIFIYLRFKNGLTTDSITTSPLLLLPQLEILVFLPAAAWFPLPICSQRPHTRFLRSFHGKLRHRGSCYGTSRMSCQRDTKAHRYEPCVQESHCRLYPLPSSLLH